MKTQRMPPAEWSAQDAVYTCWPSAKALWREDLEPAQRELTAMVRAIVEAGGPPHVRVLIPSEGERPRAERALGPEVELVCAPFGDIWLRDTGPLFIPDARGLLAERFRFNGWGGKYRMAGDDTVGDAVAHHAGAVLRRHDFVLEGGAVEWDGEGTVLTTRQCLLNPNRNPGWQEADAEAALAAVLGAERVVWLDEGLLYDHTDGHIDNLARFVAPGHVVCQASFGPDDPNAAVLAEIEAQLRGQRDARGRTLQVTTLPSPGRVADEEDEPMPASHMNFLITPRVVVVPTYDTASAPDALHVLSSLFPGRQVKGLPARHILSGGGAFHCITQQQPALAKRPRPAADPNLPPPTDSY